MNLNKLLLNIFSLNDENWLKHANPCSVWSRFATLPFVVLAVWSRVWIGWYCLIPVALLMIWIVINPTLFKKPKTYERWSSRSVLGERIYMKRKETPIPSKHKLPIFILNILQTISGLILVYGLWDLNVYLTLHGITSIYLSKMWFLDRMVWLYEDVMEEGK
ncbi:DUF6653 family protein [Marinomonas sp. GJ51-6]|uniref:DUF6653 family protein n=1 Tax=Marinomonas sp. GJ51-6 TaxID=2992802 RepID=UPI0029348803|nr:DUF6653 family protein [Marinomonas sp. GJ51-6]WOD07703.1 DUF6653 family protein [Marinomonas sp. GJ51-6]